MRLQIAAARVADRHGGVGVLRLLHQDSRHWFPDDVAAPEDHHFRAVHPDIRTDEQLVHTGGRAGPEAISVAQHEFADIDRIKTVHILVWRNRGKDSGLV